MIFTKDERFGLARQRNDVRVFHSNCFVGKYTAVFVEESIFLSTILANAVENIFHTQKKNRNK